MNPAASLPRLGLALVVAVALAPAGCASLGTGSTPPGSIQVVIDNAMDHPVLVRIDGRRIGEAAATGRTFLSAERRGIADRRVTVCVDPPATPGVLCYPGRLLVPESVREIWIDVRRTGRVLASVL